MYDVVESDIDIVVFSDDGNGLGLGWVGWTGALCWRSVEEVVGVG
jgi:hypothetical protein